ncbi:hypothetical protein M434DRAFT_31377 [Hypoxylon sp. CO27-5]|nr:hypothetical protein M434DRAFT_31377 [Hypoxylon sp. CO27-5]
MSEQKPLHPGIICAITLIPTSLILIFTFMTLKGFDLLPSICACGRRSRRQQYPTATPVSVVDSAGGSFTTIESNFIGQARNEFTTTITRPSPVHHARPSVVDRGYTFSIAHN